jgi:hypothetical protein
LAYSFKEQLNTDQPKTWIYYEQGAVENLPGDGVRLRREESSCPDNRSLGDGIELTSRFTKKGDQWGYLETLQKPKAADLYDVKSFSGRLPEMPTQSSLVGQNAGIGCLERGDDGVMYYRVKH